MLPAIWQDTHTQKGSANGGPEGVLLVPPRTLSKCRGLGPGYPASISVCDCVCVCGWVCREKGGDYIGKKEYAACICNMDRLTVPLVIAFSFYVADNRQDARERKSQIREGAKDEGPEGTRQPGHGTGTGD